MEPTKNLFLIMRHVSFFCLLPLAFFFSACVQQPRIPPILFNPDKQVVNELSGKRIVMLADYGHELPAPYQNLAGVLTNWLMMVESGECNDHCLTLFLEAAKNPAAAM